MGLGTKTQFGNINSSETSKYTEQIITGYVDTSDLFASHCS